MRAVHDYVAQNSARYAKGLVDRITKRTERLAGFPLPGALVPEYEDEPIREVFEHPDRDIYRVREDRVGILSVVHGSRLLSPGLPEDA